MSEQAVRPPLPPFTEETARQKVQAAEDAWNTRDPERVALAYTMDSEWRNRDEFFRGREAIVEFLRRKWSRELDYRLHGLHVFGKHARIAHVLFVPAFAKMGSTFVLKERQPTEYEKRDEQDGRGHQAEDEKRHQGHDGPDQRGAQLPA